MRERRTGLIMRKEEYINQKVLLGVQLFEEIKEVQFHVPPNFANQFHIGQRVTIYWTGTEYVFDEAYGGGR